MLKRPIAVLALTSTLTFLVAAQTSPSVNSNKKVLTIEAIFAEGGLTGRAPETMKWSPDSAKLSFVQRDDAGEHGELWYVDAATGDRKVLVSEAKLGSLAPSADKIKDEREKERVTRYHVAAYQWAPDSKHLLFDSQGQLWLYDLESGTAVQITAATAPSQDPKFSPGGEHLAYIREHNLYVRPVAGGGEKALTKDKDENLLNGEVDWVYAEELDVRSNYFWSPGGKSIAFLQMDESHVPVYPITDWMPTHPKIEHEKYPKAGDPNPVVRLGVVNASGGKIRWINLPDSADAYVPRFGWVNDSLVWAQVLDRAQDKLDLYFIDPNSDRVRKVLSETASGAWVKVNDDFKVLKSGDRFIWSSWRDGHTHLYLYGFNAHDALGAEAKLERQLTQGDFEVLGLQGVDQDTETIYFSCNMNDPRQQHLCSVKLDGTGMTRVSQEDGTHWTLFSDDGKHYADTFSARLSPPRLSLCGVSVACRPVWSARPVDDLKLAPAKSLEFKADDGTTLYGELLLPLTDGGQKVPLIINIYGGVAAQLVRDTWIGTTGLFHQVLLQKGFAVFSVDNRGTPGRDRKFQTGAKGQFGAIELKDQLAALEQLLTQFPQLDRERVAIWGWSNGGSMTLYSMTHSAAFKAGVSVAPVTDWHNYDSIYTERWLGLPKDNAKGYDDTVPKAADKLHGSLLLVHGTSDDNVHMQNSIQMIDAFIKAGKQFRLMFYPNKTHGIAGTAARTHLFHMIEEHFEHELK